MDIREVWQKSGELVAVLGIMDAAIQGNEEYEAVREGWEERLEEIVKWMDRQIEEVTDFGEYHDDE